MRGGKRPGAGRPKGSKTKAKPKASHRGPLELGQRVALCVADGMDPAVIAAALGIPEAQLRADYAHELANGAAMVRAQQLEALSRAADAGNASAARALLAIAEKPEPEKPERPDARPDVAARALKILKGGRND